MKYLKIVSILTLMLLSLGILFGSRNVLRGVTAQEDSWTATVWFGYEEGGYLQIVDDSGIVDLILVNPNLTGSNAYETLDVFTSADNRYIVFYGFDTVEERLFVRFGLTGDAVLCCYDLTDTLGNVLTFDIAGFEPGGSRFALSYIKSDETNPPFSDGMLVVDAATGEIDYQIDIDLAMSAMGMDANPEWALMSDWTDDGILFLGHCYACDGVPSGEYGLWQPDLTNIRADSGIFYSQLGDRLELTNELLTQAQDTDYLYNAINGIVPQPNVIHYYASGNTADTPIAVYANSAELYAGPVSWVGDGHAILDITDGGASWDLVYRDGTLVHLDGMEGLEFAGGTPDGWFAIGEEGGIPALFHYDINTLEATLVAPGNANAVSVRMSSLPALGGSIESPSFAAFPLPDVAQTALCPEFLPSRLVIGQYGQVTPGEPNRMRAAPSTDGELIGEIPAEATFLVLEGPICDVINQTAWWRVEYDGTEGWTVEGQGDTYWTEPVE